MHSLTCASERKEDRMYLVFSFLHFTKAQYTVYLAQLLAQFARQESEQMPMTWKFQLASSELPTKAFLTAMLSELSRTDLHDLLVEGDAAAAKLCYQVMAGAGN